MSGEDTAERSKRYSALKTRIFIADIVLTVLSLSVFQAFISRGLSGALTGVLPNFYAACFVYVTVFLTFMYAIGFPLHLFSSYFVEHRYELSDQRITAWAADEIKSVALSFLLSILGAQVFYLVLRSFPSNWWMITAVLWVFFSIVLARLLPVLIIPLFFKYQPITEKGLRQRILSMAERSGINVVDVCKIDFSRKTKKANAALTGLGSTRKVILADTLIDEFTLDEVETVVAHEFAHLKYRHIWQHVVFAGLVTGAGLFLLSRLLEKISALFGATGVSDLLLFPVLVFMMMLFGMAVLPVQNLFSRILERQADRFALDETGDPGTFISTMKKLSDMNLSDDEPSLVKKIFLYDHPPIGERIRMAEAYDEKKEKIQENS